MTDSHDHIGDQLSDYIDGELPPEVHAEIDRHLASCAECRSIADELSMVKARAAALTSTCPQEDLWDGVASRIAGRRRVSFTLPQLAAAGLMLTVMSGGMVWLTQRADPRGDFPAVSAEPTRSSSRPVPADVEPASAGDAHYEGAIDDLERTLEQERGRLDPETVRVLELNLEAIDAAIDQSRRALDADPANTYLSSHLASARQRKLALLRRATALTTVT